MAQHLLLTLFKIGCRVDAIDTAGNTVFTHLLRPCEKLGACRPALDSLLHVSGSALSRPQA